MMTSQSDRRRVIALYLSVGLITLFVIPGLVVLAAIFSLKVQIIVMCVNVQRLMETMRVMGDEICYRAKDYLTVHKLFATRADLHRTVYTHAKVKAVELMLVDALSEANQYLDISSSIQQPSEFWKLDDSIVKTILTDPRQELKKARDLILRIRRREIYQKAGGVSLKEEDVAVSNVRIDLTRGKNNPLERYMRKTQTVILMEAYINFFKDYDCDEKFPIRDDHISHLLPACCQDMIVRVYSKKPELVGAISEAFENFQVKIFGKTAQVYATPEKKKRRL
ncbi:hypothetical protein Pint_23000 [Pistacia integerrima]|uniref:Uncharacterized protein n=1 Tax=Pistacia integerrima TaxID=434235 RepID=A0ACC0YL06_9ROSI|nr:hypothetical protein Pint_23000 [Pistacia integerrima]